MSILYVYCEKKTGNARWKCLQSNCLVFITKLKFKYCCQTEKLLKYTEVGSRKIYRRIKTIANGIENRWNLCVCVCVRINVVRTTIKKRDNDAIWQRKMAKTIETKRTRLTDFLYDIKICMHNLLKEVQCYCWMLMYIIIIIYETIVFNGTFIYVITYKRAEARQ